MKGPLQPLGTIPKDISEVLRSGTYLVTKPALNSFALFCDDQHKKFESAP